jgi:hypothetical protein
MVGKICGHSLALIDIINEEDFKKFAEIGVWKGRSCRRILKNTNLDEYWAVDPWEVMEKEATGVQRRREKWQWEEYHQFVCRLMVKRPQLRVLRMTSELASALFPDGYFDLVYIDAIHTFERVNEDIGFWLPKVRKGGILAGHDYYTGRKKVAGVKEAVDKWFGENIEVLEDVQVWIKRI